jgi:hypothetical protein
MRKAQDNAMARTATETKLADLLAASGPEGPAGDGGLSVRQVLGEFKAVEFETTTRKVGDDEIHLRRLVITGPWEVDPDRH